MGRKEAEVKRAAEGLEPIRIVEGVTVTVPLDPYLSLKALAGYSGLSVRTLRSYLTDPFHPLPCYRVGGKVLVRRSEFDRWITRYRQEGREQLDALVEEIVSEVKQGRRR